MQKKLPLIAIALFFFACSGEDEQIDFEITIPVSIEEIKLQPIEEFIRTTATVRAIKEAQLKSESEGFYELKNNPRTGCPFKPGDLIKKGQVIIRLENPEYENTVKIESQKLNLDISRREFEKQQSLYEKGGVTLRELINSERTFVDAKYAYDNAIIQLAKMNISAPFDGFIVDLPYYTPNGEVEPNQLMVHLMDYSNLYAEVSFPAKEIGRISPGQRIRAIDYTVGNDTLVGKIQDVNPAIDAASRSFGANILLENPELNFRPGMFVQIEAVVASNDSAIVIPKEIILSKRRGKTIFVVEKGVASERTITTGLENDSFIEVIEGLKVDERLVISGFETLRRGSKVKIVR